MLSQLRDASKGWVAGLIIFFLILAFAIWGIEDIFRTRINNTVAEVGDAKIEISELQREFENLRTEIGREQGGQAIPREQALMFGLDRMALNQLISEEVLTQESGKLGLAISEKQLATTITGFPAFSGVNGQFDKAAYQSYLDNTRQSAKAFERDIRDSLIRQQMIEAVAAGLNPPRSLAATYYDFAQETRRVSYLIVPPEAAGDVGTPDDAALQTLYNENRERFTAPEYRSFVYLSVGPKDVADTIDVPEEDIVKLYEFNKEKYVVPETRALRQIVLDSAEAAQAAYARLQAGEDFVKVANENGFSAGDTDLGTLPKSSVIDSAFADAAFALAKPGLTQPIEGDFGWGILKVEKINPGTEKTIEDVRDELRAERAIAMSKNRVNEIGNEIEDARASGMTLREVAETLNLKLYEVDMVDRNGRKPDGPLPDVGIVDPAVLTQIFSSTMGDENDIEEGLNDSWVVSDLTGIEPSALKPFDTVRADVIALWEQNQRREAISALGEELAERARAGESLESLGAPFNGRVVAPVDPIGRGAVDDYLDQQLVAEIFRQPQGAVVSGLGQGDRNYVVAKVDDIVPANPEQRLFAVAQIEESLDQAMRQDLLEQYVVALREEIGVDVNDNALDRALGRDQATP